MAVTSNYLATGTQLKLERPMKGTTLSSVSTVEGPIVKLKDGSVKYVDSRQKIREIQNEIQEILFLGDMLVNYGDFYDRAHVLVPAGYCQEWWIQEVEKATVEMFGTIDFEKLSEDNPEILYNGTRLWNKGEMPIMLWRKGE